MCHMTFSIYLCDMTLLHVWQGVTRLPYMCGVWHNLFICVTWLPHMCVIWHTVFICVTWLCYMCDKVCHDSSTCESYDIKYSYVWHDSLKCVSYDIKYSYVWHDSLKCVSYDITYSYVWTKWYIKLVKDSYHMRGWVMWLVCVVRGTHIRLSHTYGWLGLWCVARVEDSDRMRERVLSDAWVGHGTHICLSHTYGWLALRWVVCYMCDGFRSHAWMSHVRCVGGSWHAHMIESHKWMTRTALSGVLRVWRIDITCVHELRQMRVWVMARTYDWVTRADD